MTFYEGTKKMQTKMHVLWSTEKKKKHYHFLSHESCHIYPYKQ